MGFEIRTKDLYTVFRYIIFHTEIVYWSIEPPELPCSKTSVSYAHCAIQDAVISELIQKASIKNWIQTTVSAVELDKPALIWILPWISM